MTIRDSVSKCVITVTNFPPMCDRPFTGPHLPLYPPIHVHRLNGVGAGRSHRLTVGTATSTILANICRTTRGHSEWALIPTQPCCGGKHSFLLVSADKQGQAVLLVTCRQPASWKDWECCWLRGPQLCHGPLWLCRGVWPPASAASCRHWSSWMDLGFEVNERWCEWARWGGSEGVVSQPCYAKTTLALVKTWNRLPPSPDVSLLPHQLAVDPGHCCRCIFGHPSVSF